MAVKERIKVDIKRFDNPDETRYFDHGKLEVVKVGDTTIGKATFEPGWKWSESVKPMVKTDLCEASHTVCVISGHMHLVFADGSECDIRAGDVLFIPPNHDAWIVGNETFVGLDFSGAEHYASHR